MAKNWDVEARELYARGEIKTFRVILAVVDKTPFSFAIGTSPKRFKELVANPAQFTFDDAYRIAAFLKGSEKATAEDEKIIVNLIHDYSAEVRSPTLDIPAFNPRSILLLLFLVLKSYLTLSNPNSCLWIFV